MVHSLMIFIYMFIIPDGDFETYFSLFQFWYRIAHISHQNCLLWTHSNTYCRRHSPLDGIGGSYVLCRVKLVSGLHFWRPNKPSFKWGCFHRNCRRVLNVILFLTSWESEFLIQSSQLCLEMLLKHIISFLNLSEMLTAQGLHFHFPILF